MHDSTTLKEYDSSMFLTQIDHNSVEIVDPIDPNSGGNFNAIFKQYEKVVVKSIITAFGLDFMLFNEKEGGEVDTVHNARKNIYATDKSKHEYENRGDYDSSTYHSHKGYVSTNRELAAQKDAGNLRDSYSSRNFKVTDRTDLDHTISAFEIHNDPGRVLANLEGESLANSASNLNATSMTANRSKKQMSVEEFVNNLDKNQSQRQARILELESKLTLTDKEVNELQKQKELEIIDTKRIKEIDSQAREDYNRKVNQTYYSSTKFLRSTVTAASKQAVKMGFRQVLGIIITEIWFSAKEEFSIVVLKLKEDFSLEELFQGIINAIKNAVEKVKAKFRDIIHAFKDGAIAGAIASISSTIINIFSTTAKNAGRILRNTWVSIIDALKVLMFNPDGLLLGDQLKAAAKILGVGISVVCGSLIQEAISQLVPKIPILADVLPLFVGSLITGLISVTFLFFMDHSKTVAKIVEWINQFSDYAALSLQYYKEVNEKLYVYLSQLLSIDIECIKRETDDIHKLNQAITQANSNQEMASILKQEIKRRGIVMPYEDIDIFMADNNAILLF